MEAVCMGLWAAFGARLKNIVPTFTWSWGGHLARAGVEPQLAVVKKGADLIIRTIRHHLLPPDCDASWETVGLGLIGSICSVPDVTQSVYFFSTLWQAFPFDLFLGRIMELPKQLSFCLDFKISSRYWEVFHFVWKNIFGVLKNKKVLTKISFLGQKHIFTEERVNFFITKKLSLLL